MAAIERAGVLTGVAAYHPYAYLLFIQLFGHNSFGESGDRRDAVRWIERIWRAQRRRGTGLLTAGAVGRTRLEMLVMIETAVLVDQKAV